MSVVTIAMTETCNVFPDMPARVADLGVLTGKLDALRDANLRHHAELIGLAAGQGAAIVGLGELFAAPYFALDHYPQFLALAEDAATGPSVQAMAHAARTHGVVVIAPIYELNPITGRRFNTAVVLDRDGSVLGKYRKTHIPQGTNDKGSFHETRYYQSSDGQLGPMPKNRSQNPYFPVFETHLGRLGVAICYDRHFDGVMYSLAANGAEIVFCPAVTFGTKSQRVWHQEFFVDAVRHNLFIAGSNRKGTEPPWSITYFGESYVCGPNGLVPNRSTHSELVLCDLDLAELRSPDPSGWNLPRDLRPDIYSPRPARS